MPWTATDGASRRRVSRREEPQTETCGRRTDSLDLLDSDRVEEADSEADDADSLARELEAAALDDDSLRQLVSPVRLRTEEGRAKVS